jgi:hypothetical protein
MKKLKPVLLVLLFLLFISCGRKPDETSKTDSSSVGNADSNVSVGGAIIEKEETHGFFDDSIPFEHYVEKFPNLKKRIEFSDLIIQLSVDKKPENDPNKLLGDWKVLADKNTSPVNWLTKGANGKRSGEVIISFENKPLETLDNYVIPVIWRITLTGPAEGPEKIAIACDELMGSVGKLDIPRLLSKKKIEAEPISSLGDPSTGEKRYKIYAPNKEPMWLVYNWSCGSGGCSASFTVYYNVSAYTKGKV